MGNLGEFFVFLLNVPVIALMGRLCWGRGGCCRRGGFSQLCCDRCWRRVMAARCSGIVVGSSEDHVRDVALDVAGRKMDDENDVHAVKRPDYTVEEWRWLYMTTGSDYYFNSSRLLGFCGVDGINWAVGCADSIYCEVSFLFLPFGFFLRFWFCFLIAVGCC